MCVCCCMCVSVWLLRVYVRMHALVREDVKNVGVREDVNNVGRCGSVGGDVPDGVSRNTIIGYRIGCCIRKGMRDARDAEWLRHTPVPTCTTQTHNGDAPFNQLPRCPSRGGIHPTRGFIQNHHRGPSDKGHATAQAALLPTRERFRSRVAFVFQLQTCEHRVHLPEGGAQRGCSGGVTAPGHG